MRQAKNKHICVYAFKFEDMRIYFKAHINKQGCIDFFPASTRGGIWRHSFER